MISNVNPFQLIQMIKSGNNPQQLMMSILQQQMGNTPLGQNLISLANSNNSAGLEQVARNLCAQRGVNFDREFAQFKNTLGLK